MRKILWVGLFLAVLALAWFLFIKKYDYQFRFKIQSGLGSSYEQIKDSKAFGLFDDKDVVITKEEFPFSHLVQNIKFDDTTILLDWRLESVNDSVTKVKVRTLNNEHKLKNRLAMLNPFQSSEYLDNLVKKLSELKRRLDLKQESYKIKVEGISKSPDLNCICTTSTNIETKQKAMEMTAKIEVIESYLVENDLKLNGFPFLKITDWDINTERINFDFCFPIDISKKLEKTHLVKVNYFPGEESLKGTFNGNYRESHLAWYELLAKAQGDGISVEKKPLEIFFNDPRMGETAIEWKAEIFMPLQNN